MAVRLEYISIICCNFVAIIQKISYYAGIMLVTCYTQNYAGIIGWSLVCMHLATYVHT